MDPVKLDELRKKERNAELMAQLKDLKARIKELKERPLPVIPTKQMLFMEELRTIHVKVRAELREVYRNRKPLILDLRLNSQKDPCCTAASPPAVVMLPAFSEDGEGSEA